MKIISTHNPKIKELIKLQLKSRERKKQKMFVVEGIQENKLALANGFSPVSFFIYDDLFTGDFITDKYNTFYVNKEVFNKIAYRNTSGGVVAIYNSKSFSFSDLNHDNLLIVILESVEKPGNLGAILRTCDAANVDAVIICNPMVDFFNPNVIRSSVGTVFTQTLLNASKNDILSFCNKNKIRILSTFLKNNTHDIFSMNLTHNTALVFGTEASGLSDFWQINAHYTIKIPMNGQVDSLNVSNAVAIALFESFRQRNQSNYNNSPI